MKKKELIAEVERLKSELESTKSVMSAVIKGGVEYKHRFQEAFFLLKEITGLSSHPQWLKIQDFIKKYDVIQTQTYGQMVIPTKPGCHWACTGCDKCGSKGNGDSWW